jgi:hypothetical protein
MNHVGRETVGTLEPADGRAVVEGDTVEIVTLAHGIAAAATPGGGPLFWRGGRSVIILRLVVLARSVGLVRRLLGLLRLRRLVLLVAAVGWLAGLSGLSAVGIVAAVLGIGIWIVFFEEGTRSTGGAEQQGSQGLEETLDFHGGSREVGWYLIILEMRNIAILFSRVERPLWLLTLGTERTL